MMYNIYAGKVRKLKMSTVQVENMYKNLCQSSHFSNFSGGHATRPSYKGILCMSPAQ